MRSSSRSPRATKAARFAISSMAKCATEECAGRPCSARRVTSTMASSIAANLAPAAGRRTAYNSQCEKLDRAGNNACDGERRDNADPLDRQGNDKKKTRIGKEAEQQSAEHALCRVSSLRPMRKHRQHCGEYRERREHPGEPRSQQRSNASQS